MNEYAKMQEATTILTAVAVAANSEPVTMWGGVIYKNLTPHPINFIGTDGKELFTVRPSGLIARVSTKREFVGFPMLNDLENAMIRRVIGDSPIIKDHLIGDIADMIEEKAKELEISVDEIISVPIYTTHYSEVVDLPDPHDGIVYIVSSLVATRVHDRDDVFIPDDSVRDDRGRIIGCRSLGRI